MNKLLLAVGMAAPLACGSLSSQAADEAVGAAREAVPWASSGWWQIYTNNPGLRPGAKGEWDAGALGSMTVLKVADGLYFLYYGPAGYFDQKDCDIRLAVYQGKLSALEAKDLK